MSILQGKGIWTFYDDIEQAVNLASQVGAKYILCKVSQRGKYDLTAANYALALVRRNPALVPVAWTYTYLENPQAEADCIQRALQNGFAAFISQVGISATRKFKQADELAQRVLDMRLDTGRIYLCADHRLDANLADMPYLQLAKIARGASCRWRMARPWTLVTAPDRSGQADGQITLHFYGDEAEVRSWDVVDATGARTRITLSEVTQPANLDRRLFRLEDVLENRPGQRG